MFGFLKNESLKNEIEKKFQVKLTEEEIEKTKKYMLLFDLTYKYKMKKSLKQEDILKWILKNGRIEEKIGDISKEIHLYNETFQKKDNFRKDMYHYEYSDRLSEKKQEEYGIMKDKLSKYSHIPKYVYED